MNFFLYFLHSHHILIIRITRCISIIYPFYCIHSIKFLQFFLRKTVIFHFIVIFISIKQYIIMMTIFFILYFATIYILVAVYPFFIKGMVQLVNDLSRIFQFIILFIVTSICIMVKKWRKRKNNG